MQSQNHLKLEKLPQRNKGTYSGKFKTIVVSSNHYNVNLSMIEWIYVFKISINPIIHYDNAKLRNTVIMKSHSEISKSINNPVISGLTIYSITKPLFQEIKEFIVDYDDIQYKIQIKKVKEIDVIEKPNVLLQLLNNGLRNIMNKLNYIEIGRTNKFFDTKKYKNFDNIKNLRMYSGFKANFTLLQKGIFLRVDTAKKIVRQDTVLQIIDQLYKMHQDKDKLQRRQIVKNELTGKIVMTNYGKTKYYRIANLQFPQSLEKIVIDDDRTPILQYYKDKYKLEIRKLVQPLIQAELKLKGKQTNLIYLIPQLCQMTGIPENFDEFKRKQISQATIRSSGERRNDIQKLIDQIKDTPQVQAFKKVGINISQKMHRIQAKIIPAPRIELGSGNSVQQGKQSMFNLFSKPIYNNKHNVALGIVYFDGVDVNNVIDIFESTARNLKTKLQVTKLKAGQPDTRKGMITIENLINKSIEKDLNICLIIIPNSMKSCYKKLKQICLLDNKVNCQICTEGTLRRKNVQSICTKILLQIIAKRGNTLWVPKSNTSCDKIMLAAFDTSKAANNKSIIATCATGNNSFTSIFSKTKAFKQNQQKFKLMVNLLLDSISYYTKRNQYPPKQVIVFQNSCSHDQVSLIKCHVIQPILNQLDATYKQSRPNITFIQINTRSTERLFSGQGGMDSIRNVPAGTVIANEIVSKNYDFYMISQYANKGSTVPNHYEIIYTDSNVQEGNLQEIIYSQCFNYVNWTGSIKVPGIMQYAKKCAKFNAEFMSDKDIPEAFENKLYYV